MSETLSPEAQKKLFPDNDKENQETFTDADFTNNLSNTADIAKSARPSSSRKHRQTESNLQERLAVYQAQKKQKNQSLVSRPRSKSILQPVDTNANPPGGAPFTPTHKTSFVSSVTLTPVNTPLLAPIKTKPVLQDFASAPSVSQTPSVNSPMVHNLAKPPRPSDVGKRTLESNEVRLAKERNINRQQELNEREAKLNARMKEVKNKESKVENDMAVLERQKKLHDAQMAEKIAQLNQDKQLHQQQLRRCECLDEEMSQRERELSLERERQRIQAQEVALKQAAELETIFAAREAEFAALCRKRNEEIEALQQERQIAFAEFEISRITLQQQVKELRERTVTLNAQEVEAKQTKIENEVVQVELQQWEAKLTQAKAEFEEERRLLGIESEKHCAREAEFLKKESQHQAAVKHAQEVIANGHSLELKIARDQDTLKQQQKVLDSGRDKLVSDTLDWRAFKDTLIFENEQLKNEALLVTKECERLECSKRTLAGEWAAVQAQKSQVSQSFQQLEAENIQASQAAEKLSAAEKIMETELARLENKQKQQEEREVSISLLHAANEKTRKELEQAAYDQGQSKKELDEKRQSFEVQFASLLKMQAELSQNEARIQKLQADLDVREQSVQEDRVKTQRMQALLVAEEGIALEREAQHKRQEEEVVLLYETCEKMMREVESREAALASRDQEVTARSVQLEKFQAVFAS